MSKSKENPLLNHLQSSRFCDEPCRIALTGDDDRLNSIYMGGPGDWSDIARIIFASASLRPAWFPDANVAILDETTSAWEALRVVAFGSNAASTMFTAVVRHELKEWLEKPFHHEDRAEVIRLAIANGTWAKGFGLEENSSILPAIFGYVRLFGLRRYLARPTTDGLTMLGTNPEQKSETMNAIGNQVGRRAQRLAKKGRIDAEENQQVNINDELHCLMAICHSLLTGRESVILTADEDLIEIFFKAQWFFDTHYRAYLAAKLVGAGRFGTPEKVLQNTHGYFDGPLTLYRRQTSHLREVLPTLHRSAPVSVIYVAPNRMIHKIGFIFEREMLEMLEVRSKTQGRCTDLFGEDNIHVDLGPLTIDLDKPYLGIGRDKGVWAETNNTKAFLSQLDIEHALNCRERFAR